jgi:hypothetical protein
MRVLQLYHTPLTLVTFVNYYKCLSSLRLSNQMLWLNDRIATLMLVVGAVSSWTYAVMLGCSSSMAGNLGRIRGIHLLRKWGA